MIVIATWEANSIICTDSVVSRRSVDLS